MSYNSSKYHLLTKKLYKGICPKELLESYIDGNPITAWLTVMVKTKCIKKLEYTPLC